MATLSNGTSPASNREYVVTSPSLEIFTTEDEVLSKSKQDIEKELHDYVDTVYVKLERICAELERRFGDEDLLKKIENSELLRILDLHWVGHLTRLENMRQSIGLQAVGQRDPLVQYRTMSFQMFNEMNEEIRNEVARTIFHNEVARTIFHNEVAQTIFHLAPHIRQQGTQLASANTTALKTDALAAVQRMALAQAGQQSVMSSANTHQQGMGQQTITTVNAPTHSKDGRRLSRKERRAIERRNKKKGAKAVR